MTSIWFQIWTRFMGRGWYLWSAIQINVARSRTGPEIIQYSEKLQTKLLQQQGPAVQSILKASYSSKIDIFIQERFNKLIYGINMIINVALIQRYHKKSFQF